MKKYTTGDLDLLELKMAEQSRRSFWAFRQHMHPKLIKGWFARDASRQLQTFHEALVAGQRPKLLLMAPPQHGKSMLIIDFIAWAIGQNSNLRSIYASFSSRLGTRANLALRRMMQSRQYMVTFPVLSLPDRTSDLQLTNDFIEFEGGEASFRNTTVKGAVTGESLDLGVIDDPIKGSEEARSETARNNAWDWLTDDFMTRFTDKAGLLGIMTRWHLDDPFGRLIDAEPTIRVLRYTAIADHDETNRKAGEALFPEHKPLAFLLERKRLMLSHTWSALYQQNPVVSGGNLFKDEWWVMSPAIPPLEYRVIYADTASKTKTQNDWSVFQCWGKTRDGKAIMLDMIRGKWEAPELLIQARAFWDKNKAVLQYASLRSMKVEDASSGTGLIQTLKRKGSNGETPIPILGIQRNRDKVSRANDVAPMVATGQVMLLAGQSWLSDYLGEVGAFPNGKHDDMVDPTMDAINDMLGISGKSEPRIRQL
jgi:predicted phage terminase large subunit-like protein